MEAVNYANNIDFSIINTLLPFRPWSELQNPKPSRERETKLNKNNKKKKKRRQLYKVGRERYPFLMILCYF